MQRRWLLRVGVAIVLAAVFTTGLRAYTTYARWAAGSATFFVNPANADVAPSAAIAAIQVAMAAWTAPPEASFRFEYAGTSADTAMSYDGRNVLLFRGESNGSTLATTYSWWNGSKQLLDSDIVFWDGVGSPGTELEFAL